MGLTPSKPKPLPAGCTNCKLVADNKYHRLFLLGICLLAIVLMVLVWFTGLVFQIVGFILAFLILALGALSAALPVNCIPCSC